MMLSVCHIIVLICGTQYLTSGLALCLKSLVSDPIDTTQKAVQS